MRPPVPHTAQRWLSRRSDSEPDPDMTALGWLLSETAGYAVRRTWPDGLHELLCFRSRQARVERLLARDMRSWQRGPIRPVAWHVVPVDLRSYRAHDGRCPDVSCVLAGLGTGGDAR
ncbi:hypothetical protein GCM10022255_107860 [Dactylosporangium darangshiense]|uniref:Uncharacterized protein n=1 Tax=Dactylosporangium darangshiense TaxID=579108 RepID=A0ABP8DTS1_9ACTN